MMENFGNTAVGLSRNPVGIFALFITLVYGIAALVSTVGTFHPIERYFITAFILCFPLLILGVFTWLVIYHHQKLYAPSEYPNGDFLKTVETKKEEITALTEKIVLISYVMVESSGLGGMQEEHIEKIKQYHSEMDSLIDDGNWSTSLKTKIKEIQQINKKAREK
jgi:hypothetical protein